MKKAAGLCVTAVVGGAAFLAGKMQERICSQQDEAENVGSENEKRLLDYYGITTKWIEKKQEGVCFSDYLLNQGIERIGIYGQGVLGMLFYGALKEEEKISVEFFTDIMVTKEIQTIDEIHSIPIEEIKNKNMDAIIITPVFAMSSICDKLKKCGYSGKTIGLNEVIITS